MELCGVRLRGPVLNGSGTFDAIAARRAFGDALIHDFPFDAFVSKTITLAPREGNPPPRLWESPSGLVNSIGLPNKGLKGFLAGDLPKLAKLPVPLIVSVMGFTRDELAMLVKTVGSHSEVAMIELNFSCPNVETGTVMGADPVETAAAVEPPAAADPQAADREADPQRDRPERGRRRRRGGRSRRRVPHQHAARDGARPAARAGRGSAGAPAACPARPCGRLRSRRSRTCRSGWASR